MSNERKHINFTIVPDETGARERVYTNFCAVSHTPFDFTLTFCEVLPPTEQDLRQAQADQVLRAPVRARVAIPVQLMPNLIAALQDHMRIYSESFSQQAAMPPDPRNRCTGARDHPRRPGRLLRRRRRQLDPRLASRRSSSAASRRRTAWWSRPVPKPRGAASGQAWRSYAARHPGGVSRCRRATRASAAVDGSSPHPHGLAPGRRRVDGNRLGVRPGRIRRRSPRRRRLRERLLRELAQSLAASPPRARRRLAHLAARRTVCPAGLRTAAARAARHRPAADLPATRRGEGS
jgi:hypothetical protein